MRTFTGQGDPVLLGVADVVDNDVTTTLEPPDGTFSLEAHSFEEYVVEAGGLLAADGAKSVSVQFYGKATADGDVSSTWTALGSPVVASLGSTADRTAARVTLNRQGAGLHKYVSAIATFTHVDQGTTGRVYASLSGNIPTRVNATA